MRSQAEAAIAAAAIIYRAGRLLVLVLVVTVHFCWCTQTAHHGDDANGVGGPAGAINQGRNQYIVFTSEHSK